MKVIFLDIDGVICSGNHLWTTHSLRALEAKQRGIELNATNAGLTKTCDKFGNLFDPVCVMNLKKLVLATGAKIVISSSWRRSGLAHMRDIWKFRKLPGDVIDITPQWPTRYECDLHESRGYEIKEWLEDHPDVERYIIIDDDICVLPEQEPYFIKTTNQFGLEYHNTKEAINILNQTK